MLVWVPLQCKEDIMLTTQTGGSLTIQPGATVHFVSRGRQRLSFRANGGFVWLTRDGDIKDYLLSGGDAISVCAGDHVWMTLERADRPAAVTLEALDAPRRLWGGVAGLFAGWGARPCEVAVRPGA
jgi:hypothetical protein